MHETGTVCVCDIRLWSDSHLSSDIYMCDTIHAAAQTKIKEGDCGLCVCMVNTSKLYIYCKRYYKKTKSPQYPYNTRIQFIYKKTLFDFIVALLLSIMYVCMYVLVNVKRQTTRLSPVTMTAAQVMIKPGLTHNHAYVDTVQLAHAPHISHVRRQQPRG